VTGVSPDFLLVRKRARPMSPDDRRAAIIDATIPLLKVHGREVSTRQIADAAGVAEGTLFRAFGDKDTLISAAIERFFDPQPFRDALRGIDPDDPTEDKIHHFIEIVRIRFEGVVGFMSVLGHRGPPPGRRPDDREWIDIVGRAFRPDELAVPVELLAYYVRIIAFSTAIPSFNEPHRFTTDELVGLVTRGVLPRNRTDRKKD